MRVKQFISCLTAIAVCGFSGSASAAVISGTYAFSASQFATPPSGVDPVLGQFTITFDNSVSIFDSTAGFSLDSMNIIVGPAGYSYTTFDDTLTIGGLVNGVTTCCTPGDFTLSLTNFSTSPQFSFFATPSNGPDNELSYSDTGDVTVVTAVPEPGTFTLFGAGILSILLAARRRNAVSALAVAAA